MKQWKIPITMSVLIQQMPFTIAQPYLTHAGITNTCKTWTDSVPSITITGLSSSAILLLDLTRATDVMLIFLHRDPELLTARVGRCWYIAVANCRKKARKRKRKNQKQHLILTLPLPWKHHLSTYLSAYLFIYLYSGCRSQRLQSLHTTYISIVTCSWEPRSLLSFELPGGKPVVLTRVLVDVRVLVVKVQILGSWTPRCRACMWR